MTCLRASIRRSVSCCPLYHETSASYQKRNRKLTEMPVKDNLSAGSKKFVMVFTLAYMAVLDAYERDCSFIAEFEVVICGHTTLETGMLVMVQRIWLRCGKLSECQGMNWEEEQSGEKGEKRQDTDHSCHLSGAIYEDQVRLHERTRRGP